MREIPDSDEEFEGDVENELVSPKQTHALPDEKVEDALSGTGSTGSLGPNSCFPSTYLSVHRIFETGNTECASCTISISTQLRWVTVKIFAQA